MTAPRVLRAFLIAALALAAFLSLRGVEAGGTLTVGPGDTGLLASALVSDRPPARIAWSGSGGPDGATELLLSPGPAVPPLTLPVGTPGGLRVVPPARPVAGRASALDVTVGGLPEGDSIAVAWRDELGGTDSVTAVAGAAGRARVGLRVRPARAGWHEWTVLAGADSGTVGAWVLPERPVRVLALAGVPDWEARFALRALDEAGVQVDARFDLGRVEIGAPDWDLDAYDVVLLLGRAFPEAGGPASAATAADPGSTTATFLAFVRRGGGLVIAAPPAAGPSTDRGNGSGSVTGALLPSLGLATSVTGGPSLEENALVRWALPAELTPLPPAPVRAATVALVGASPAGVMASAPDGTPLVAARAHGRGRAAVLGVAETWRWRMEAGALDAHRAWWRSWVEWAASGLRDPVVVRAEDQPVPVGAAVRVIVEALDSTPPLPSALRVERPGGAVESVPVAERAPDRGVARFLARDAGSYRVSWPGGETGVEAVLQPPAPDPSEVAVLAISSGRPGRPGRPLPPDGSPGRSGATSAERRPTGDVVGAAAGDAVGAAAGDAAGAAAGDDAPSERPWRGGERAGLPLALGALIAVLALAEWTVRRARGGP